MLERADDRVLLTDDFVELNAREIRAHIGQLSQLIERACAPGSRVGLVFPNSAVKALAVLAVLVAKRVPVMLNGLESYPDPEHRLADKHLSLVLMDAVSAARFSLEIPAIGLDPSGKVKELVSMRPVEFPPPPAGTAVILYTSGSSGLPKGVCLPEAGLLAVIDHLIEYQGFNEETVATVLLPICHTMGLNTQFLPAFLAGGRSEFFDSALALGRVYRDILESRGTCLALVSRMIRLCYEEKRRKKLPAADFVRSLTLAGGAIRAEHLEMAKELFPNAVLYKGYGLTEAIRVSMIDSRDPAFSQDNAGYALPGQTIEIRDDASAALPVGEIGRVFVRGSNVMLGYEAGDASVPSSVGADGFLDTKDVGFLDPAGRLVVLGRSDGIVKIYGKRVPMKTIEEATIASAPGILDAKCLAFESERNELDLILFVERGEALLPADFELRLREKISRLPTFPRALVVLPEFPKTSNGKVDLSSLRALWETPGRLEVAQGQGVWNGTFADVRRLIVFVPGGRAPVASVSP